MPSRKRDRTGRNARSRYGTPRRQNERSALPIFVVVCDDKRTAVRALKEHNDHASSTERTSVWALIDKEADHHHRNAAEAAKSEGERLKIEMALSDPCFEVWTLLHLCNTGEHFANCNKVNEKLREEWNRRFGQRFDNKAKADYQKIMPLIYDAIRHARSQHDSRAPSSTEVYRLVEAILECDPHKQS